MVKFMSSMKSMAVSLRFTTRLQTFICNHPHGWFLLLSGTVGRKTNKAYSRDISAGNNYSEDTPCNFNSAWFHGDLEKNQKFRMVFWVLY